MARDLPRFQPSGVVSADIPRLDFANVRESARASASMSEGLDRISQFAFGQAERQRKEENRIIGIQMRSELESEVQRELNNLDIQVETGQISNFNEIQSRVQSLQGLARGLAQVDPDQANGLMLSINNGGKALLKKSSDILVKAYGAQQDVRTDQTISTLQSNLQSLYAYETDQEAISRYEAGARNIAFSLAAQNPLTLPKKLDDFEKARLAARDAAMTNYFVSTEFSTRPSESLAKLRAGDAGKFSPMWQTMDEGQRDAVVQRMLKRQADDLQVIDRDNKLSTERNRASNYVDYNEFYLGRIGGREELKQIREGDIPGAPDQYFGGLEFKARQGQMNLEQADELFRERRISLKQRNTLFGLIDKTERPEMARARDFIRNSFVPNPLDPSTRQGNVRRAEVENQLFTEENQARAEGKPFDAFARAQVLVRDRQNAEDVKELAESRKRLRQKLEEIGLSYNESYTKETLDRAGKGSAQQRQTIIRIINSINANK
jgi:hypothetical protein